MQTYLLTAKFFGICLFTFTLAGLEFALHQVFKKRIFKFSKKLDRILAVCLLISFAILVYNSSFFSLEFREDWKKVEKKFITLKHTTIFNWYESFSQYLQERNSFLLSAKVNENIHASAVSSHPQNIIVIIGESFIKHHSSLYGYHLETNPKLASLENLYVFDNVISPINATSDAFKNFLSLSSIDEQKEWYDSPLFPAVFKAAGYNVIFFSNQFVKAAQMSTHDASCGFFNHPSLSLNLFNHRNSEKYEFDENLLDFYKSVRNEIESDSLNLILLHLYGQHVRYSGRFPKEREHFKIADYANRTELSESEKQEVADYDNATLYNDSIVYEIITMYDSTNAVVVYFSDHGDEVNDYRPHIGRSRNLDVIGAPGLHCQLDIPFLIHISPSYKHLHPGAAERINAAVHKPFIIDDLPHVLMDLAKINYDLYQPQRSLVNSMFNENRKRIVRPLASQQIDYDSVCTKYGKWKMGYERK
ncbi:heptose-I-phosphate ethanolaminephosphotransferase [Fibrobacter intestinalis]|uniref:Heptose-I-phosphate ethanolaminephosphotransferase n=1 Tax=Fibrobacter intestinalis TaxID=28122 RepID=A0A1T4QR45_9BACT|nr:glucan phosphoethanolaminetransferase (alkaline phosphatase superfamily) [Fibrobacter sp. NR9]SKA06154.1 heptose-I-phosphate ethanolaminephosphotransferase [Fibrobacter intestinalis]